MITLAGASSRFFNSGYEVVKYKLKYGEKTIIENILSYIPKQYHLIIAINKIFNDYVFFENLLNKMEFSNYQIIEINSTKGQLETVFKVLEKAKFSEDESLTVFNGDTIRKNYNWVFDKTDGIIEVFNGEGNHWSFIDNLKQITNIREKKRISNLCSDGLYFFKNASMILSNYYMYKATTTDELYISEFYNFLIEKGYKIEGRLISIDSLIFCGTPKEYNSSLKKRFKK